MTPDPELLDGVCVVTGASGGLGRALAHSLAARGATVACLARREDALAETCEGRDGLHPFICDVGDPASVDEAFAALRALGPVRVLVNNAAVYPRRDVLDETAESFMQTVSVNLGGTFAASRAALDDMVAEGRGRILNVATFADIAPIPLSAGYSVSKGAARILTRAMLADLGDRFPDIVIGDWLPGMLRTGMGIPDGVAPEEAAEWGATLALWHDRSLSGTTFEMATELLPGRGLKGRVKDLLMMRRRAQPRRLA
ncbi:SDR family oxidoreductase [Pseudaestuariivita atlantica]|uniref:Oxidoreductase n=1 Tax=Pseudaestuariivita atlantica TaxID=1317121 RepID=A0A0L1JP87_9RHOB|nr:SDR family oxidoreductase [Pseudaestuariivita atlantica]KNG93541.1 oxidoreductase [Pseudaestuariivita atlantica]